jgi:hypothetical protein
MKAGPADNKQHKGVTNTSQTALAPNGTTSHGNTTNPGQVRKRRTKKHPQTRT